jgi:hypothetical protein
MARILLERTQGYPLAPTLSGSIVPSTEDLYPIVESEIGAKFTAVHIIKPPTEKSGYGAGTGGGTGGSSSVTVWTTG